jgi:hypothetical protein
MEQSLTYYEILSIVIFHFVYGEKWLRLVAIGSVLGIAACDAVEGVARRDPSSRR